MGELSGGYPIHMKFLIGLLFILPNVVFAIDFEDAVFPEIISSARAQAMGNAYICKVDDSHAAFYNPAGLGTVRLSHIHLTNLHLEMNKGWIDTAGGGKATEAAGNFTNGFDVEGLRSLMYENGHTDKITHTRFQTMPNLIFRFFTAGFALKKNTRAYLGPNDGDQFEYADRLDFGPYAAMNISLGGGIFKLGAMGMILTRHEAQGEAPADQTLTLEDDDYNKGTTEYVVAGSRLTLPIQWLPTFAAVMHNATSANFKGRAAGAPDAIKQQIDVGFSLTPQIAKTARLHLEANLKDIGGAHGGVGATRRLVFGAEIDIKRAFFLRFGYGDGFGSGGLGIKSKTLEFDLTTYAVDTTTNDFRGKEDRRFALSLSAGF
jgi:hypothetical protein